MDLLAALDRALLEAVVAVRLDALTPLMALLSAWWVKGLAIPAIGVAGAVRRGARAALALAAGAGAAFVVASAASDALKAVFDRARPPLGTEGVTALVTLPADASLPSGHATTAFAAAGVVALVHPRLRAAALALAALVAMSRVYLGVHHPLDVVAGALLGLAIAALVVAAGRRAPAIARRLSGAVRAARMRRWRSTPST